MIAAWRITKRKHAKTAFTGEGARLYGGRWNSPGINVIYAAESPSLAALEMLVHLDSSELLGSYAVFEVTFDEQMTIAISTSQLPGNWRREPFRAKLRAIGDEWARSGASAVLQVPSLLMPIEKNFVFNPRHTDFGKVHIGQPAPFHFDVRLKGSK